MHIKEPYRTTVRRGGYCGDGRPQTVGSKPCMELEFGLLARHHKDMVKRKDIERLGVEIGNQFHPRRVILFGSYARGAATEDSDVDIFVEMDHTGREVDAAVDIRTKTRPRFPVDILVRSPEKIHERLCMGDTFVQDILDNGATLYEATD